ncbi:hypothetical protein ACQR16_28530 [Bradyrhizobium oligotrophicum]|uniref:hypothetical protein n=1 Tax=Bradyrhizobium oligotrophicum TaxID=44255 RepID=UPI003EBC924E
MASDLHFDWVRDLASPQDSERREEPSHALISGFHDDAMLTLSPSLTTAVVAIIAACTVSLGVSVTIVVLSIQAIMSA